MPDTPIAPPERPAYDPSLEARVTRLEYDRQDMQGAISQLGANVAHQNERLGRVESEVTQLNERLGRVEIAVAEIKTLLLATLPHLTTKADIAEVRSEATAMKAELINQLSEKPSKTYMWGVLAVLLTAYACGLAALAYLK